MPHMLILRKKESAATFFIVFFLNRVLNSTFSVDAYLLNRFISGFYDLYGCGNLRCITFVITNVKNSKKLKRF